jgi:UDP-N-acetylglucosamine acyltransferase
MVGGKSKIVQDVLPFFITDGNPARVRGLNAVGLKRAGFTTDDRRHLRRAYQILLGPRKGELETRLRELELIDNEHVHHLYEFVRGSQRGFTRAAPAGRVAREIAEAADESPASI